MNEKYWLHRKKKQPLFTQEHKAYLLAGALFFSASLFTHLVIEPEIAHAKTLRYDQVHTKKQVCAYLRANKPKLTNVSEEDYLFMCGK